MLYLLVPYVVSNVTNVSEVSVPSVAAHNIVVIYLYVVVEHHQLVYIIGVLSMFIRNLHAIG